MAKLVNSQKTTETRNNATAKEKFPADGIPAKGNQVLAPSVISINEPPHLDTILNDNLETFTRCGQTFYIGYFATNIPDGQTAEEVYDTCNKNKNKEINEYLKPYRKGRCVRGYKVDGTPITCWKKSCKGCSGCDKHGIPYECYNPDSHNLLVSLEEHVANTGIDFADKPTVFYGDEEDSQYPDDKERLLALLNHLEKNYPRHYTAFKMMKDKKSAEEISTALGLSSGSKRVYTIMDETMRLCYKFFGSGILSTKAILDYKRREKAAKKNLLF